jgi:hypothetical protein
LPNLLSLATSCVCLELRSLPSPALPGFIGTTNLSATHSARPVPRGCPVDHPWPRHGLPVLRTSSLCTYCRHYPRCSSRASSSLISPGRISLPRYTSRVGLHIVLFEACSAFTHVAACTLARSPIRDPLSEGFSHFVTSMTAPVASGWSVWPDGDLTHWKTPPCHGAPSFQTSLETTSNSPTGSHIDGAGMAGPSCLLTPSSCLLQNVTEFSGLPRGVTPTPKLESGVRPPVFDLAYAGSVAGVVGN